MAKAMDNALVKFSQIDNEFGQDFGRKYGAVEAVRCDDADIIMVTSGTITSTCRLVIDDLREKGKKAGCLR